MKNYDLKSTFENLLNTYCENTIDRNIDVLRFVDILNSIEGCCSIAVDGNWGSGKTFFVKQVKMVMDAHNPFIKTESSDHREQIQQISTHYNRNKELELQPHVCVYYDAWENDNDEDPIVSLVYAILQSVETDFSFTNRDWAKAGANIIDGFIGHNWAQIVESLRGTTPFDALKEQRDMRSKISDFLASLLPEKGDRLIVFVDELDRCKPSYAVRLLERIKHYFDHDNITFVFSVNTHELQHTIKKHYGDGFDSSRYLDRFFDLRVTLSPPNLKKYYQSIEFNDEMYVFDTVCSTIINAYHFELREIAKFLRLAKTAAHDPTHSNKEFLFPDGKAKLFMLMYVVPITLALKIRDLRRYSDFIQGKDHTPLLEILNALPFFHFNELLSTNETYEQGSANKQIVKREDKIKSIYDALFITSYDTPPYQTRIGEYEFNKQTRECLLKVVGLLSEYTKLD